VKDLPSGEIRCLAARAVEHHDAPLIATTTAIAAALAHPHAPKTF
jgi:hypothetical protein